MYAYDPSIGCLAISTRRYTTSNFTEARIVSTWEVTCRSNAAALTVDAHFPSAAGRADDREYVARPRTSR